MNCKEKRQQEGSKMAEEIWRLSIQEMFSQLPFLCLPYGKVQIIQDNEKTAETGLSKNVLTYHYRYVLEVFAKEGRQAVNRAYVHMLLHMFFCHTEFQIKEEEYSLACDIVAEYILDCLEKEVAGDCLTDQKEEKRRQVYERIQAQNKITVSKVKEWLILQEDKKELKELFHRDDHQLWGEWDSRWQEELASRFMQYGSDKDQMGTGGTRGRQKGEKTEWYEVVQKRRRDYRHFLKRFAVTREEMQMDMDGFDYIPYLYGLKRYGNMPLIEHLEYVEAAKLEEMVIAIDTSSSCSRSLVQKFLEETYDILSSKENFFKKMNVRILQCDCYIQEDVKITCEEDWKTYMKKIKIQGRGGTDFRPVFRYVEELRRKKEIRQLRGLLYFTDGDGIYPIQKPPYETAFVFSDEKALEFGVPDWAVRLFL